MSTSETVEFNLGACPCGSGNIVRSITTQDNPWSSADMHQYVNCPKCATEWRLERDRLVQISSEAAYKEASRHERACRDNLNAFIVPLVDQYFKTFAAKTKKAEHAEMARLGIFDGNYRYFLKRKHEGSSAQICYSMKNPEWLAGLARASSMAEELDRLNLECEEAKSLTAAAAKTIVRRPLPEIRLGLR